MVIETLLIGLVSSLAFVELTGFYAGGLIVPGYVALYVESPLRIVGTVIVALVTLATFRFLSRYLIIYGRRRFVLMILIGSIWTLLGYRVLPGYLPGMVGLRAIGWIVPGLIANTFQKQGVIVTVAGLIIVSSITYFIIEGLMIL